MAAIKGGKQQGVEVKRLHQEPEEIGHDTVVTEDDRGLAGKLVRGERRETGGRSVNQKQVSVAEQRSEGIRHLIIN